MAFHRVRQSKASGVKQRLENLGYLRPNEERSPHNALRAFQADHAPTQTGVADRNTRERLVERHKS